MSKFIGKNLNENFSIPAIFSSLNIKLKKWSRFSVISFFDIFLLFIYLRVEFVYDSEVKGSCPSLPPPHNRGQVFAWTASPLLISRNKALDLGLFKKKDEIICLNSTNDKVVILKALSKEILRIFQRLLTRQT